MSIYDRIVEMVEKPTWKSLLIDTVKSEGLDPWDIDINRLATRFAKKIREIKDTNLRIPANAVLASSILLRFKSDNWVFFPDEEEDVQEIAVDGRVYEIPELPAVKRVTRRKVTLDDLIRAIEDVMQKEVRKKRKMQSRVVDWDPEKFIRASFFDSKDIEGIANKLIERMDEIKDEYGLVRFSQLVDKNKRDNVVETILTLLYLANDERIFLWQEDYFDEIIIKVNGHGEERAS